VGSSKCHEGEERCSCMIYMCDVVYMIYRCDAVRRREHRMESLKRGLVRML